MADYIEREALMKYPIRIDHYDKEHGNKHFVLGIESVIEYAKNLPAADVAEVRHGRWIDYAEGGKQCTACKGVFWHGEYNPIEPNYCPNCGARMDKEDKHEVSE